jgi:hypothetical protein
MSIRKRRGAKQGPRNRPHGRLTALSFAHRLWEALDTPTSLSCHLLAKYCEFEQLVRKEVVATYYLDAQSFYADYQAVKILSRFPNLATGIDTDKVAKQKFLEAELKCLKTNDFIRNGGFDHLSDRARSVLCRMSRKISTILGDVPSLSDMDYSFGPGAAFGVRGDTSVYRKVCSRPECTYAFAEVLQEFLEEFPGWFPQGTHEVELVPGSQLSIVPKNAKTGRPICIEPLLNGLYQKGVGSWIRKRLKKFGVDLDDQNVNQKLASLAHSVGLSTVDFASASDTIAYMLVLDLLPLPWFEFLDVARCSRYQVDGEWYNFHKFTSMGNAYTFELETLIFYAMATSACEELGIEYQTGENLSVYGDDVIIPRASFGLFHEVAEACGFGINESKSFVDGPFFESCGHDFFLGSFVRPTLFSKELNKLNAAFYAANQTRRGWIIFRDAPSIRSSFPALASRHPVDRDNFLDLHRWVVGCIDPRLRVVGPEGYGDGHLVGTLPQGERDRPVPGCESWDGWWFRTYVERPIRVKLDEVPTAYALYFARARSRGTPELSLRSSLLIDNLKEIPEPLDNGSGYGVRSRTSLHLVKVFLPLTWQDTSW